jgi:hypothetical protein
MIERVISLALAIGFFVIVGVSMPELKPRDPNPYAHGVWLVLLSLACIWFGDYMGTYVGPMRGLSIHKDTPGCFMRFLGWAMLIGCVIMAVAGWLTGYGKP